jgi:hypothetical protein
MKPISSSQLTALLALSFCLCGAVAAFAQPARSPDAPPAVTGQTVGPARAPAAQTVGPPEFTLEQPDWSLKQREDRLVALVDSSLAEGDLDRAEAERVKAELAQIEASEDRARRRHDGELTDSETFRLEGRIHSLAGGIHWLQRKTGAAIP